MTKKGREAKKQFSVGVGEGHDFTPDYIEALIYKIALWFGSESCDRTYEDPVEMARQKIRECLLGETASGDVWQNVPREFANRVRAKCAYDIATDKGIPSTRTKHPLAQRALDKKAQASAKSAVEEANPVNGEFDSDAFRKRIEGDILEAFPELDNAAHRPNVRSLSLYHTQRELIDRELALKPSGSKRAGLLKELKDVEEMADTAMHRLGIHPDQLRKKISDRTASTVADLVAMLDGDDDYRAREKTWALQLALQLWWMWEHRDGLGAARQISDFEFWHLTRSRPMQFTCRHGETYTLVEGFEPHQLHAFLKKNGVLIEEPAIPGLFDAGALSGLDAHFTQDAEEPTDGPRAEPDA
jgi:hypothetical protein